MIPRIRFSFRHLIPALALSLALPAGAELCTTDQVPAATLLVPYFEVNLDSENSITTLLSLQNTWPEPTLANITLWTDWSQPTINFNVFLTGYDSLAINLREVFNGQLPITADAQSDPLDDISPHGDHPEWDGDFEGCENFFPYTNPALTGPVLDLLRNGHTGNPVQLGAGQCVGSNHGDNFARGYVTIDDVSRCALARPSDPEYFAAGDPIATTDNQLTGDFFLYNGGTGQSLGAAMVHIEADPSFDVTTSTTGYTFYGRYTAPGGLDSREPLGSVWDVPYIYTNDLESDLVVWRDSTSSQAGFFSCGVGPSWAPLESPPIACWNWQEDVAEICTELEGDEPCFPLETQRLDIGSDFSPPFVLGWCRLDLSVDDTGVEGDVDFPSAGGTVAQSWAGTLQANPDLLSGFSGVQIQHACGQQALFADGFETGDTARWSSAVP